ncbi:MAG: hypothetical protein MJ252_23975 [archaeon]|nr:hypothetical protein [archaeon]
MKRNKKCLNKMIAKKMKEEGILSQEIVTIFKKIFYLKQIKKMNSNQLDIDDLNSFGKKKNPFELTYNHLKQIIDANFKIFKKEDPNTINTKEELEPFLKSCGNLMNEKDMEFFTFIAGEKEKLTIDDLFKVCGTILQFREKKNVEIINEVFDSYYDECSDIYKEKQNLQYNNIEVFLERNSPFFESRAHKDFILEQCKYLGEEFSLDSLISMITTPSQFYPF